MKNSRMTTMVNNSKRIRWIIVLSMILLISLYGCRDMDSPEETNAVADTINKALTPEVTDTVPASDTASPDTMSTADTTAAPDTMIELLNGQIGDFTVADGVLTAYTGSEKELVIPAGVVRIGSRAFEESPAADSIKKITLGRDVKEIDTEAFFGLPSLRRIDVDQDNSAFKAEIIEYSSKTFNAFLCGLDEQIIFYFSDGDGSVSCIEEEQLPDSYSEDTDVTFICGNAVFDIFYENDMNILWYCRSVRYDENQMDFETPIYFLGGNYGLSIIETGDRILIIDNDTDIYYVTKSLDDTSELHSNVYPGISFYLGNNNELRYRKIGAGYDDLEQIVEYMAVYYMITDRDQYYGEDGYVLFENGGFKFVAENVYTISDYFKMHGTDIDTWFNGLNDNENIEDFHNPFDSLEELMEYNRNKAEE